MAASLSRHLEFRWLGRVTHALAIGVLVFVSTSDGNAVDTLHSDSSIFGEVTLGAKAPVFLAANTLEKTIDGILVVGSPEKNANNRAFFQSVELTLKMSKRLPDDVKKVIFSIPRIEYQPTGKIVKDLGGIGYNISVYRWEEGYDVGQVYVYQDMTYSSPLYLLLSFIGNAYDGLMRQQTLHLVKILNSIKNKEREATVEQVKAISDRIELYRKRRTGPNEESRKYQCFLAERRKEVAELFGASPQLVKMFEQRLRDFKCY